MKQVAAALLVILTSANCGGITTTDRESQVARLGSLSFEVPDAWTRTDSTTPGGVASVWTPPENPRKESVTIIRSEGASIKAQGRSVGSMLLAAQATLRRPKLSTVSTVITEQGLAGSRVRVSFNPQGSTTTYRREHVVLTDGTALVHVLYTAVDPDENLETLNLVLETLRPTEG